MKYLARIDIGTTSAKADLKIYKELYEIYCSIYKGLNDKFMKN